MITTVWSDTKLSIDFFIYSWDSLSSALVASSNNIILLCLVKVLAIDNLCFCPPDKLTPPSPKIVLYFLVKTLYNHLYMPFEHTF